MYESLRFAYGLLEFILGEICFAERSKQGISDNKIYHYHLNLGGSVSTRRLTRLPSIPKNDAKFRYHDSTLSLILYLMAWQNTLIQDGKEMASVLYTYRSCVKALPQGVCWTSQFGIQKLSAETGAASIYCGFWF
ncbi:hypothetical protein CXB51_001350 [Gossypium anomalum]|uniref:Uncharacterized protein n=1 Tax=Gossypium anomalum TaxID=47600 RepID=A0A8J6A2H7_9ROSI|nr:hypothetical protein CXB51_001350 [Gossypium anomalum]